MKREGEEGENTLQLSSLKSSSVRIRQSMTKENDNTCSTWFLFFAAASFSCNHISHLWQTVLVIVTSEVGSQSPSPHTLLCLLPQVEQIKRMQSSFSWQCFLTHTVQEVAEGTKRCPNIFYTFS